MKLLGPEARGKKLRAREALGQEVAPESVFQFDPLTEISPAAWEAIENWKQWAIDAPINGKLDHEWTSRQFFSAIPLAAYLQLMNPEHFHFQNIRGRALSSLSSDDIRRDQPKQYETALLNQLHAYPKGMLYSHGHRIKHDGENVFSQALIERHAWNESLHSDKRYWEQPSVIQKLVVRFSTVEHSLQQLALYAAALPELREHLDVFVPKMQEARLAFRKKLALAMRDADQADWQEIIKEAFTLTLLGSDTQITDEGLVIKKRNISPVTPRPNLPERPAL